MAASQSGRPTRMTTRRAAVVALVALVAGCARSATVPAPTPLPPTGCGPSGSPTGVVCQFYERYLDLRPVGLPTEEQQAELSPLLTERLQRMISVARARQSEFAEQFPGEKPPLVDGCLFASLFEGPTSFELASAPPVVTADGGTRIAVKFRTDDDFAWEDVVVVRREPDRFAIDDVEYAGAGEFNPAGRLSDTLEHAGE